MVPIEEIIYCFPVYRLFRLLNLTVVYMFCILARWLSIVAASINYHVKAHVATWLHNNNHKGLTSRVSHYTHFQVFSSYPQIWWSSPAPLIIPKNSVDLQKTGETLNFSWLLTSADVLLDHARCLEEGKRTRQPWGETGTWLGRYLALRDVKFCWFPKLKAISIFTHLHNLQKAEQAIDVKDGLLLFRRCSVTHKRRVILK